jgi:hypothetical protein
MGGWARIRRNSSVTDGRYLLGKNKFRIALNSSIIFVLGNLPCKQELAGWAFLAEGQIGLGKCVHKGLAQNRQTSGQTRLPGDIKDEVRIVEELLPKA